MYTRDLPPSSRYIYTHIPELSYNLILVVTHFALVILNASIYDNLVSVRATVRTKKLHL
jgi:hypothetical protein